MMLSDLDGFLTGIICSPDIIPPSQWLPIALGGQPFDVPADIIDLIMRRHNDVVTALNRKPPQLEPVFWKATEGHVIAMDWCEGFMDALHLRTDSWDPLLRTEEGRDLMFPIFAHLFDKDGRSLVRATEEQMDALLDTAAEMIPETVPQIFRFWQSRSEPEVHH